MEFQDNASQTEATIEFNRNNNNNNDNFAEARSNDHRESYDSEEHEDGSFVELRNNNNNNVEARAKQGDRSKSRVRDGRSESANRDQEFYLGPRVRGRSQRRATDAVSTMSAPCSDAAPSSFENETRRDSPGRPMVQRGRSPRSPIRLNGRSAGNLNGFNDMAAFRDTPDGEDARDGSTHRAESLTLPSATWTPPSLRHFGFPAEFREFLEVNAIRFLTPWAEKVWNLLKDDYQQIPHNWKNIPNGRRTIYVITGFVSCYYFVVSLYAIPLVALGFLTPAYLCRQYLENDGIDEDTEHNTDNNNNDDVKNIIVSVREMSLWMKFWVSFCGWLLASSMAPGILTAIFPLKIITLLFVVASLVIPWKNNPSVFLFDRLLVPLFQWTDGFLAAYKEKIIHVVSSVELRNKRRRE